MRRAALVAGMRAAAMLALGCWNAAGAQPSEDAEALERRVKAAFLYRFLEYVEWPAGAGDPSAPFVIGTLAADEMATEVQATTAGRSHRGRPIVVQPLRPGDALAGVHMLFVPAAQRARLSEVARAAVPRGVLVVSEGEGAIAHGSAIAFRVIEGRVRFEVALDAAERGGLRLSSRLLSVAYAVRGAP